ETLMPMLIEGRRAYLRDRWRRLDLAVALLTLLCGAFFLFRRVVHHVDTVVEDVDVPILCLRFALQPIRMISTASMVVRARMLHQEVLTERLEETAFVDPRRPCALESVLSLDLAAELRDLLPSYLKCLDWQLAYSPKVHGTSMNTFYRQQDGPNILVVRDAHGGLFGGFATEPWKPQEVKPSSLQHGLSIRRQVTRPQRSKTKACERPQEAQVLRLFRTHCARRSVRQLRGPQDQADQPSRGWMFIGLCLQGIESFNGATPRCWAWGAPWLSAMTSCAVAPLTARSLGPLRCLL
ncbi:unnamed protein product, partial [Polarella glacialis]